jgi:hypothetical protein
MFGFAYFRLGRMERSMLCLLYAFGNVIDGEEGVGYDRKFYKNLRVVSDELEFEKLKEKIIKRLNLDPLTHDIEIEHRFPILTGCAPNVRMTYTLSPIIDDGDVEEILGLIKNISQTYMLESYIKINEASHIDRHDSTPVIVTEMQRSSTPINNMIGGIEEHAIIQGDTSTQHTTIEHELQPNSPKPSTTMIDSCVV